jgi:hypothetical protein
MNERSKVGTSLIALALAALALCGCQSSQHSQAQLAQICADPANRANVQGNLYYDECLSLYPVSPSQRSKAYLQGAPE